MFANVCTKCGKRELVFSDQIRSLQPTPQGFEVRYVCTCGAPQVWRVARAATSPVGAAA